MFSFEFCEISMSNYLQNTFGQLLLYSCVHIYIRVFISKFWVAFIVEFIST